MGQEVIPLYDQWRISVMEKLKLIMEAYEEACSDDGRMDETELATNTFKARIVSLWLYLGQRKVSYPKGRGKFDELYGLNRYLKNPAALSCSQAINYFILLRDLIECLGYTRPEKQKFDPRLWSQQRDG